MPFPTEHAARQTSPDRFIRFRRQHPDGFPVGVDAVFGVPESGGSEIQSIRFAASKWTEEGAKAWLKEHDFSLGGFEKATGARGDGPGITYDTEAGRVSQGKRFDLAALKSPQKTDEGFLRVQGHITRAGVFEYAVRDGAGESHTIRELRSPEEVFADESLRSFALVPLTLGHPSDNLTPSTVGEHQVGSVGTPERADDHVKADILITSERAINAVEGGQNQLSCGYTCQVTPQSGTFRDTQGQSHRFDAVQSNIKGNHLAIVPNARAGHTAAIRMDAGDGVIADWGLSNGRKDMKIKIGDAEVEVSDSVGKHINSLRGDVKKLADQLEKLKSKDGGKKDEAIVELTKKLEETAGKLAAMDSKIKAEGKADADEAAKEGEKKARKDAIKLVAVASPILSEDMDSLLDMDAGEVRRKVIAKLDSSIELEGKSEDFVAACFAVLMSQRNDTSSDLQRLTALGQDGAAGNRRDDDSLDAINRKAHQDSVVAMNNAWKPQSLLDAEKRQQESK